MDIDASDQNANNLSQSSRRYFFDTPSIKSPQSNMELTSFLKDGMSKQLIFLKKIINILFYFYS